MHRLQLVKLRLANHDEAQRSYGQLLHAGRTRAAATKRSPICRRSTNDKLLTGAELLQRLGIKSNAADRDYFHIEVGRA